MPITVCISMSISNCYLLSSIHMYTMRICFCSGVLRKQHGAFCVIYSCLLTILCQFPSCQMPCRPINHAERLMIGCLTAPHNNSLCLVTVTEERKLPNSPRYNLLKIAAIKNPRCLLHLIFVCMRGVCVCVWGGGKCGCGVERQTETCKKE